MEENILKGLKHVTTQDLAQMEGITSRRGGLLHVDTVQVIDMERLIVLWRGQKPTNKTASALTR